MRKSENNPTRPKETFFGFWLKSTAVKIVFIAILIVCAIIVVRHYMKKTVDTSTPLQIVTNQSIDITPTQIRSIEQIGKWSFLEISDEEIVDTIRRGFFSDDELVRIYYGTLRLGIDTRQAHEGWIAMRGDTLCATLPPVKLLDNDFIDETRTRSFIETGKWSHQDRMLMYNRADAMMRRRCLTRQNYLTAQQNAKTQFENLLRSMGFEYVKVGFEK